MIVSKDIQISTPRPIILDIQHCSVIVYLMAFESAYQ